jgi:guanylate kinase
MSGRLLLVSGLSGAGKTTLIRAALRRLPQLSYLQTVTTRPPRPGEDGQPEYIFVTEQEYERRKNTSSSWDHSEYQGYKYGADVHAVLDTLQRGGHVICALAPDETILEQMKHLYKEEPVLIWIDTPKAVSAARIQGDALRAARHETADIKQTFHYMFTPTGDLSADEDTFCNLLEDVLSSGS